MYKRQIEEQAPWKLYKENKEKVYPVLYRVFDSIKIITNILYPFMPGKIEEIKEEFDFDDEIKINSIPDGFRIKEKKIFFPRIR